jgi:hypothetical protein
MFFYVFFGHLRYILKDNFINRNRLVNIYVNSLHISQNLNERISHLQKLDSEGMSRSVISITNRDCNQVQTTKIYYVPRQTLQRYSNGRRAGN